jgi:DNA-binding CsgD family transcriptional regulator
MPTPERQMALLKPSLLQLAHIALSTTESPEHWQNYLAALSQEFEADFSFLAVVSQNRVLPHKSYYFGLTRDAFLAWQNHWDSLQPQLPNDFPSTLSIARVSEHWHVHAHQFRFSSDLNVIQAAFRKSFAGPFHIDRTEGWPSLAPFVRSALHAGLELDRYRREYETLLAQFGNLGIGVIELSTRGRILNTNATARGILSRREDIASHSGQLAFLKEATDVEFRAALEVASHLGESRRLLLPHDARYSAGPMLVLMTAGSATTVLVYLIESSFIPNADAAVLEKLFSWTPAEAKIAAMLATGMALEDVCAQIGITVQTARTHLKHLFAKTGFSRQGQLIAFINRTILRLPGR